MNPVAEEILARGSGESIAAGVVVFLIVLYAAIIVAVVYVYSRIVKKAGYPWPWIFIMLVPVVNIVMFCIFALKEWPIERELARTRAALAVETGSPYPDPTVFGYGDYPIDYADTALYAGPGQQPGGYPNPQVSQSPFGAQYPAPGTQYPAAGSQYPAPEAQGYSTPAPPYGQPDAGWQGQNGGLYGGPTDEPRDPKNPWAPKG